MLENSPIPGSGPAVARRGSNEAEQVWPHIVQALGDAVTGKKILDLGCETGRLTEMLAQLGAEAEGTDNDPAHVRSAQKRRPSLRFASFDGESLPYEDGRFDCVVSGFGLARAPVPDRTLAEIRRVLRPKGRLVFAVWAGPERGNRLLRLATGALLSHGTTEVPVPPAPPMFRLADPEAAGRICGDAGFSHVRSRTVEAECRLRSVADVPAVLRRTVPHLALLLEHQSPTVRAAIEADLVRQLGDQPVDLPFKATLTVAHRSD